MAFDPAAAREQFALGMPAAGRTSTQSWGWEAWTAEWRVDGGLSPGALGIDGGAWWVRALTDPGWLAGEVPEPTLKALDRAEAKERLASFIAAADDALGPWPKRAFAPIAFPLREVVGAVATVEIWNEVVGTDHDELVRWLGPLDYEAAGRVVRALADPAALVAISDHWEVLLERLTQLNAWSEAELAASRLPIEARAEWLLEHNRNVTGADLADAVEIVEDDTFEALAARALRKRDRTAWEVAARRPLPGLVDLVLPRVDEPIAPWALHWFQSADDDVLSAVVERAMKPTRLQRAARRVLRHIGRRRLRGLLPEELADDESLFASEVATHGELPRGDRPGWMTQMAQRSPRPEDWLDASTLPMIATKDGFRLPTDIRDGLIATLQEVRFGTDRDGAFADRYDAALDELPGYLHPESADEFWSALFARWWSEGHPQSGRWVLRSAAFLCSGDGIRDLGTRLGQHRRWFGASGGDVVDALARNPSSWAIVALDDQVRNGRSAGLRERARKAQSFAAARAGLTPEAWVERNLPDERHPVLYRIISDRLRQAMTDRRPWSDWIWRQLVSNPSFGEVASEVLWSVSSPQQSIAARWDGESFVDVHDGIVDDSDATVFVAHPAELDEAELRAWNEVFADYEIVQPFGQLMRRRFRHGSLSQDGYRSPAAIPFDGPRVLKVAARTGWEPVVSGAHGEIVGIQRRWPRNDVTAFVRFAVPLESDGIGTSHFETLFFTTLHREKLDPVDVDAGIFSEAHLDVTQLFGS